MTRDEAREFVKVVQAYADGKEVEGRTIGSVRWQPLDEPVFNCSVRQYRIKPEPREVWILQYGNGEISYVADKSREDAEERLCAGASLERVLHFREVIE